MLVKGASGGCPVRNDPRYTYSILNEGRNFYRLKDFNYLLHISVETWKKYISMIPKVNAPRPALKCGPLSPRGLLISIYMDRLRLITRGSYYWHGLTFIPARISNHMCSKIWGEITYPFPNFNCYTVEVWECVNNFITRNTMDVITYPC